MIIYPKEDIINIFNDIIFKKGSGYECEKVYWINNNKDNEEYYVVKCELIANEYPILGIEYIKEKFYTMEDIRDITISTIIK